MQAHALETTDVGIGQLGWVIVQDVRSKSGKRLLRKGAIVDAPTLEDWHDVAPGTLHFIELDESDVHEDSAGRRIAEAVSGEGIRIGGPIQSRYNLIAERKGLLTIESDLIRAINTIDGVTVFTHLDRQTVLPGKVVAGVKITPIAIPKASVEQVEHIVASRQKPPISIAPFEEKRVAIVATDRIGEKLRDRFRERVEQKFSWYGSTVSDIRFVDADPIAVANALEEFQRDGVDIIMAAGGNTIDPLDPIYLALNRVGAEMIHFGAPAHPGSMFWLARVGDIPIFNLASCSMYSQATVADLILPLVMSGRTVTSDDVIDLGYGGLLEREMSFRFPDYGSERTDEEE